MLDAFASAPLQSKEWKGFETTVIPDFVTIKTSNL